MLDKVNNLQDLRLHDKLHALVLADLRSVPGDFRIDPLLAFGRQRKPKIVFGVESIHRAAVAIEKVGIAKTSSITGTPSTS